MKRHESRNISRRRAKIEALGPCTRYSTASGVNPFAYMLSRMGIGSFVDKEGMNEEERQEQHRVKMASEQKAAKARQLRKRNKTAE